MDSNIVVKVENLHKKFCRSLKRSMAYGSIDIARNMLGIQYDPGHLRKGEFWSLNDINFELKKGDALGIIGQNGSGKSTLLRLLNGIYPPDKGQISIRGKIGALIAVGAGFHPHLTGRENIYLNGTILGMSKAELDKKFEEIIKFADIGDFLDAPVATYSSGMSVRLGFAIAIHSEPEILLADEILAVGDLGFALKCYRKISEFRENGGSLILVSHSIQLIRNTCNQVLWIHNGTTRAYGDTQKICDEYESFVLKKDAQNNPNQGNVVNTDPLVHITGVDFVKSDGTISSEFVQGEKFTARIHYKAEREVKKPIFTFSITNPENILVISNYTKFDGFEIDSIEGDGMVEFSIDSISLKPSEYTCSLTLSENGDINGHLDWHDKNYRFSIVSKEGVVSYGILNPFPKWSVKESDPVEEYIASTPVQYDYITKYIDKNKVKTILDIGACEGEDSIRYSNLFPNSKVYSFEPLEKNFEKIKFNLLKHNKVNSVKPFKLALSDKNGTAKFFVSSGKPKGKINKRWDYGNKSSSLLQPNKNTMRDHYEWLEFQDEIKVETKTLDKFCEENNIREIDIAHIDVQGAELMVLTGGLDILKNIKFIFIEVSTKEFYSRQPLKSEIEEFLIENNFNKIYESISSKISGDELYVSQSLELGSGKYL